MTKKMFYKIFLLIIILASFLRLSNLGSIPVSLYWDEAAMLIDAKTVSQTGLDMHGNHWSQLMYPSYGDYKLPVYIWLASISVKLFGVNEWALRLPSALAGIGTIITSGIIARFLFKNSKKVDLNLIQLLTMLVITFSPWSIMFSRTAFEGHLAQFLVSLSILVLMWLYSSSSPLHLFTKEVPQTLIKLVAVSIIGSLATYTYFSVRFVWPVIFMIIQLFYFLKFTTIKIKKIDLIRSFILSTFIPLFIFIALLIPMVRSPLYEESNRYRYSTSSVLNSHDYPLISNNLREIAGNNTIDRFFFHRNLLLIKELAINYGDHLSLNYLFINGDDNLRHGTGVHGLFLLIFLPIFIYGVFKLFLTNKRALMVLTIWWIIALLPASAPETTPHALRSLNGLIPLTIIIGFGLTEFINFSLLRSNKKNFRLILVSFSLLTILNIAYFLNHYTYHYPVQSAPDWQDGYKELALTIDQYSVSVDTVWVEPFEGRFYLWLLAFGDYSANEIQNLPKNNYQISKINNIEIAPYDWGRLKTNSDKTLVVGETNNIKNKLGEIETKPNWIKEIYSHDGVSRFSVVEFGK
jgi:4-amino-4-deoxy-L-arabinose transferase-like glycosyltransferase